MKKFATIIFVLCLTLIPHWLLSQAKCKVLLPAISETYTGKCKKGLANGDGKAQGIDTYEGRFKKGVPHGIGTYSWANGDQYTGQWEFGKRQGEGVFKFNHNSKDSILEGIWNEDIYIGPTPPAPVIIQRSNIQSYTLLRQGDGNKLTIEMYMNGAINHSITNISIISSNGSYQNFGDRLVYNYIMFPCTFKITYITSNKMLSAKLDVIFEFELSEPGDWTLRLIN